MQKIKIIRETSLKLFEREINKLLYKGWKMKGKLIEIENFYYQVMKKDNLLNNKTHNNEIE